MNDPMPQLSYQLAVNGTTRDVTDAWIGESLLHVVRERLGFAGAKSACEQGECGSCSMLVDGALVCACLVPAASVVGCDIRTIESIGTGEALSVVQQAFVDAGAVQCGFCTPGLVMAVHELLDHPRETQAGNQAAVGTTALDDLTVREALSGNLCRCTGYARILDAVARAVEAQQ